jgi:hypothetical protein
VEIPRQQNTHGPNIFCRGRDKKCWGSDGRRN